MAARDNSVRDNRRNRRDRQDREEPKESSEKEEKQRRKKILYIIGGTALFIILVLVSSVAGAYKAAMAVQYSMSLIEDEEEDTLIVIASKNRQTRLLDIARDKPLIMSGDPAATVSLNTGLTYPGRATESYKIVPLNPESRIDLGRPFVIRKASDNTIETSILAVSTDLASAGRLGRSEELSRLTLKILPIGIIREKETEAVMPLPAVFDCREFDEELISSFTYSTIQSPVSYNDYRGVIEEARPEAVGLNEILPDVKNVSSENAAPIESKPQDESYTRGRVR